MIAIFSIALVLLSRRRGCRRKFVLRRASRKGAWRTPFERVSAGRGASNAENSAWSVAEESCRLRPADPALEGLDRCTDLGGVGRTVRVGACRLVRFVIEQLLGGPPCGAPVLPD